jgi:hypothetical protein
MHHLMMNKLIIFLYYYLNNNIKIFMYRDEDIDKIRENINKIIDDSHNEYKKNYEPTMTEVTKVYNAIKDYIIRTKKIAYGGFAQNTLLMNKNKSDSFYKIIDGVFYNFPDVADLEFYSPNPIKDMVELLEELYKQGFKHIEGKNGVHNGTYKIFINFINYCDIAYMPEYIYNNLPTITTNNNIRCAHPHFMVCDAYRIMTDPMTSYWRLEKAINRFNRLINYYPITNGKTADKSLHLLKPHSDIMRYIRKNIVHNSKLIVVGFYAFDYYNNKIIDSHQDKEYPYYELITDDIIRDAAMINKQLKTKLGDNITTKQFSPFLEFFDRRVEFYHDNKLILRLFGNNKRCVVYRYSKNKTTYFGTYNLTYMYLLFDYFYNIINKNHAETEIYSILLSKIAIIRNTYLENHNITVIEPSPFQDFTLKCLGEPVDIIREFRLQKNKSSKFNYKPSGKMINIPKIIFDNISGNEILDIKKLFYKNI